MTIGTSSKMLRALSAARSFKVNASARPMLWPTSSLTLFSRKVNHARIGKKALQNISMGFDVLFDDVGQRGACWVDSRARSAIWTRHDRQGAVFQCINDTPVAISNSTIRDNAFAKILAQPYLKNTQLSQNKYCLTTNDGRARVGNPL